MGIINKIEVEATPKAPTPSDMVLGQMFRYADSEDPNVYIMTDIQGTGYGSRKIVNLKTGIGYNVTENATSRVVPMTKPFRVHPGK